MRFHLDINIYIHTYHTYIYIYISQRIYLIVFSEKKIWILFLSFGPTTHQQNQRLPFNKRQELGYMSWVSACGYLERSWVCGGSEEEVWTASGGGEAWQAPTTQRGSLISGRWGRTCAPCRPPRVSCLCSACEEQRSRTGEEASI